MTDITIPRAALEAGITALAEGEENAYTTRDEDFAAAIAAALAAWPGMRISWLASNDGAIVLPLPQQASDDQ
jgi:hypothetical protein